MALEEETTVYPENPSTKLSSNIQNVETNTRKIALLPSVSIILENPLFSIDPLLLIRICSFLDMLSVMRFECVSLRITKFLKKNIQLQSLQQSNTDYYIDHALNLPSATSSVDNNNDIIPIFSELSYRFPNRYQYDHYILLETDNNIFGSFQHIKQLHLRIIPPNSNNFVSTPSSSYLTKLKQHEDKQRDL